MTLPLARTSAAHGPATEPRPFPTFLSFSFLLLDEIMSHVILLAILIPSFADNPLEEIIISDENEGSGSVLASIQRKLLSLDEHEHDEDPENVIPTLLIRPSDDSPGLFAYHNPTIKQEKNNVPNIRATRLAMACGLFSMRFYGSVVILKRSQTGVINSLTVAQIETACCGSPDLRSSILSSLGLENQSVPHWLRQAAQNNYHDQSVVQKLADVMKNHDENCKEEDDSGDERRQIICLCLDVNTELENRESREIVTMVPLCFNCRRPANDLCTSCHGVYFCGEHCRRQWYVSMIYDLIRTSSRPILNTSHNQLNVPRMPFTLQRRFRQLATRLFLCYISIVHATANPAFHV